MSNNRNIKLDIEGISVDERFWELRECPICGKRFYARKKYKKITCSDECHKKYIDLHRDEINKKRSISCYNSYHNKTIEEINKEHQKAKKTCLNRYGVECYQKTDEYRKKQSKLFKEKDWSERSKKIKEQEKTKYNEICINDDLELIEFRNRFDCTVRCKKCGNTFDIHVLGYLTEKTNKNLCRHCHPNINSTSETHPINFIETILIENNIIFYKNDRSIIKPYEIDIVIPDLKIGIEVNGNYWHSEISCGKTKEYHINKTIFAYNNGYKLIQIFEDEIVNKPDIVKSRILNIIEKTKNKIFARKTIIKEIDYKVKKDFLTKNHIDGDSVSKYNYGLYYNDDLVSVATFGMRKISGKPQFELIRFANKINTSVIGGFSKLLKHFIIDINPNKLITYADIRWSGYDYNNTVYLKNGFKFVSYTQPNYFYEDRKKYLIRLNRMNFTKSKLVKNGEDENLTEKQIMFKNNYDIIYDCGSMKFEYVFKK